MKRTSEVDDLKSTLQFLRKLLSRVDDADELSNTRIHLIAQSKAFQRVSLDHLRITIETRLKGISYPYPEERRHKGRTFFQWIESHGGLEILLSETVLEEIRDVLYLVAIAKTDSQYQQDARTGYGSRLKFHREMLSELERHQTQIDKLRQKYKVPEDWTSNYETHLGRQQIKEVLAISSSKWPGERKRIMGTGWKFDLASALWIYAVLHKRLSTKLSDRCLQMLAPIIACGGNKKPVSYGALRNALARRK